MKTIKWYHWLFLWMIKSKYTLDLEGISLTTVEYKRCCGHMYIINVIREKLKDKQ